MITLDASLFIAGLFADEANPQAQEFCRRAIDGEEEVLVPPVFLYEICNTVALALRRRRFDPETVQKYFRYTYTFPVSVDTYQDIENVVKLSLKHQLTVYDAAYLELAKRESLPLITFDKALAAAAKKEKVPTLL